MVLLIIQALALGLWGHHRAEVSFAVPGAALPALFQAPLEGTQC